LGHLFDLARAAKLEQRRDALFAGEKVNATENRPARKRSEVANIWTTGSGRDKNAADCSPLAGQ